MKHIYVCESCKKTFDNEEEALLCEKRHKEEAEQKRKLKEEKESRRKEVDEAYKKYSNLLSAFVKDYPELKYNMSDPLVWLFSNL